jgi:hypothetical protein
VKQVKNAHNVRAVRDIYVVISRVQLIVALFEVIWKLQCVCFQYCECNVGLFAYLFRLTRLVLTPGLSLLIESFCCSSCSEGEVPIISVQILKLINFVISLLTSTTKCYFGFNIRLATLQFCVVFLRS